MSSTETPFEKGRNPRQDLIEWFIDLFNSKVTTEKISRYIEIYKLSYIKSSRHSIPHELRELINSERLPEFIRGDIILNQNLPHRIDFAYCKKLIINWLGNKYDYASPGPELVLAGLRHISQCVRPNGMICVIEYDPDFRLEEYFILSNLKVLTRTQFKRREIRSKGRTNVFSTFTSYLCSKVV